VLAIDWANLQVASAFVVGCLFGSIATIRVMRAVLQTYERYGMFRGAKKPPPSEDDGGLKADDQRS
jgi:hypothetical protein